MPGESGWLSALNARMAGVLPPDSLRARLVRGTFWNVLGQATSQAFGLLASVLVARLLEDVGLGEFGMVRSTLVMFGLFAGLGLGITATRYIAECRDEDPARAGRIIGMSNLIALTSGGFIALIVFLLAPWLAARLASDAAQVSHLVLGFRLGCVLLLFEAMDGAQLGVMSGLESFRMIAQTRLLRGAINFPVMLCGAYAFGVVGAVLGLVAVTFCAWMIDWCAVRRCLRKRGLEIRYEGVLGELSVIWKFALPASIGGLIFGPVVWLTNMMLVLESGFSQLGLFTAANIPRQAVINLVSTIGSVLLPILSSREGRRSVLFQRANVLIPWVLSIMVAIPVLCFPGLIGMAFGKSFEGRTFDGSLVLIMLMTVIYCYKSGLLRMLAVRNLMWWSFLDSVLWGIVLLGTMFAGRHYGSIGLAVCYILAYGVNTLVFVPLYVRRGLVERSLIWSWNVFLIWLTLIAAAVPGFLGIPFWAQCVSAVVLTGILGCLVYRVIYSRQEMMKGAGDPRPVVAD